MRALISEFRWPFSDWPYLIPLVRYALNQTSPADRPAAITLFTGLNPSFPLDSVWNPRTSQMVTSPLTTMQLAEVSALRSSLEKMHRQVGEHRDRRRNQVNSTRTSHKPNFSVGDFVLVSNVLKRSKRKLSVRWTGPHHIVETLSDYIYVVEHLVTHIRTEVHCSRLRFYCDASLNITQELVDQVAFDDEGYEIARILDSRWNNYENFWEVYVAWRGFETIDYT